MNPLVVAAGLLLLFFLPGFALLSALFPRHRWFGPFHPFALPALSIVTSVVILVLVGSVLGFLPGGTGGRGWFQGNQTGAPIIELSLGALTFLLFIVAWARGAFPLLRKPRRGVLPTEARGFRTATMERDEPAEVTLLRDLRLEEARLNKESRRVRTRARESRDPGVRNALSEAADDLERQRADVSRRAAEVERRATQKRFG